MKEIRKIVKSIISYLKHTRLYTSINQYVSRLDTKRQKQLSLGSFIVLFAVIGTIALLASHAASPSPYASIIADSGTLSGAATEQACSGSSDGNCVMFGSTTTGPNIYVAQNAAGNSNGNDCNDAYPISFFNTSSNWGTGTGKIGPGVTVDLCGTINSDITFYGSGSSGNPITVYFEPGAKISEPNCTGGSYDAGCIYTNNQTYLTIDGGTNGIIENTAMGTGLANPANPAVAIWALNCSNCTIKNLTIQNMYVHTSESDNNGGAGGIIFSGSNLTIADNTMHDIAWDLNAEWNNGDSNIRIYGNNIYNIDHGFASSAAFSGGSIGPIYFYDNHVHDYANWDTTADTFHHDGLHCFSEDAVYYTPHYNGFYIYDNRFDGSIGNDMTSQIFLEGGSSSTPCSDSTSNIWIFNNVLSGSPSNATVEPSPLPNTNVINNTATSGSFNGSACYTGAGGLGEFENNIADLCGTAVENGYNGVSAVTGGSADYNLYADSGGTGGNEFVWGGTNGVGGFYSDNFATWQGACGCDGHSKQIDNTNHTAADLNSDLSLESDSPAIGMGINLYSLCSGQPNPGLGALCTSYSGPSTSDPSVGVNLVSGNTRPSSGPWDIGAYQYSP